MNIPGDFTNFRPIRHDRLLQEQVHDAYKLRGKLHEPTVCPQCNAVYQHGHWRWLPVPQNAEHALCSACHRLNDHYPAGYLVLSGPFFQAHHEEVLRLVHNHEQREKEEHPLQRIMKVEKYDDSMLVTTTDIHLARGLGEALQHAYQGTLDFHYNPEENLLRVNWSH